MSFIRVNEVGDDSLERVNKLLHNIPGGVYKAAFSALRRAGDTAKTRAGQFAAAEYTINKGEFMRRVHSKTHITGGAGGVMGMSISFSGTVLPLLTFNTTYSRDGTVQTQVPSPTMCRRTAPSAPQRSRLRSTRPWLSSSRGSAGSWGATSTPPY